jgi:hypothetical protein
MNHTKEKSQDFKDKYVGKVKRAVDKRKNETPEERADRRAKKDDKQMSKGDKQQQNRERFKEFIAKKQAQRKSK